MGNGWIDRVIQLLQSSDYQVRRGYPVGPIPYLTAPVIAVCVEKIVPGGITLRLHIYCPLQLGGEMCEDTAIAVMDALSQLGGVSTAGACRFDENMGLFTQSVEVSFAET